MKEEWGMDWEKSSHFVQMLATMEASDGGRNEERERERKKERERERGERGTRENINAFHAAPPDPLYALRRFQGATQEALRGEKWVGGKRGTQGVNEKEVVGGGKRPGALY
ncbi:hypothetical protein ABEB36_006426 [Hypothenemus hampei]|uniref:Uncharacterized protein n=1 Tax=Hypothenemus hampei TaxID=57062 RepID=A0ABD1EUE6_HYPHA